MLTLACSASSSGGGDGDGDGGGDGDVNGDGDGDVNGDGDGDVNGDGDSVGDGDGAPATGGAAGDGDAGSGGTDAGTGGSSGDCVPNPAGSSVDQGDGTFIDERTCLMWMKEVWPNTGEFIGRDHAADCVNATTAGYDDWRGPDAAEMVSLLRLDGATCAMWNSPNLWDAQLDTSGLSEPVMFYTASEGDGMGSEHQCAINGNTAALDGGTRKNPWSVVCVRGTSPITGTIASCVGTACDYQ